MTIRRINSGKRVAIMGLLVSLCGLSLARVARAEGEQTARLGGRVVDRKSGGAVEGVQVVVKDERGRGRVVTTDRAGRYTVEVRPGVYGVTFIYGTSRTSGRVTVGAGVNARLDGRVDESSGEVIVIEERRRPAVLPRPKNYSARKAPPYSDRAIEADAWTRAWLFLDLDETGRVTRFKFLKRPGYDLETIAAREVFKLRFEPGRDAAGKPVKTWIVWLIEWPSYGWLIDRLGVASGMPPTVGFPPRSMASRVPCKGSGPLNLDSVHPTYRDCSRPDLSKTFDAEPWVTSNR